MAYATRLVWGFRWALASLLLTTTSWGEAAEPSRWSRHYGLLQPSLVAADSASILLRLAAIGTVAAQRQLAKDIARSPEPLNEAQWLLLVRQLFGPRREKLVLAQPLRRTLVSHIRGALGKRSAETEPWQGTRSQSTLVFGFAAVGGEAELQVLNSFLRGEGPLAELALAGLLRHRPQSLNVFSRSRPTPSVSLLLARLRAPRSESKLALTENEQDDELSQSERVESNRSEVWTLRRQVARALQLGRTPGITAQQVDRWLLSEDPAWQSLGAWSAALRRPKWAQRAVASLGPIEVSAIASNALLLSDEVHAAAARRLATLPDEPLRSVLGFSLLRSHAAALVPTHVLRTLARQNLRLRGLAMRALSERCDESLEGIILTGLADSKPALRAYTADGLRSGEPGLARRLLGERYRVEPVGFVRRAIVSSLVALGGVAVQRLVQEAATIDPDRGVRAIALGHRPFSLTSRLASKPSFRIFRAPATKLGKFEFVSVPLYSGLDLPLLAPLNDRIVVATGAFSWFLEFQPGWLAGPNHGAKSYPVQ